MDYGNALMNTIGRAGLLVYFAGFFGAYCFNCRAVVDLIDASVVVNSEMKDMIYF